MSHRALGVTAVWVPAQALLWALFLSQTHLLLPGWGKRCVWLILVTEQAPPPIVILFSMEEFLNWLYHLPQTVRLVLLMLWRCGLALVWLSVMIPVSHFLFVPYMWGVWVCTHLPVSVYVLSVHTCACVSVCSYTWMCIGARGQPGYYLSVTLWSTLAWEF